MNRAAVASLYLILLSAVAIGCDGVGRPLVDRSKVDKYRLPVDLCGEAPCDTEPLMVEQPAPLRLDPVVLDNCAALGEPRPDLDDHPDTVACADLRWTVGAFNADLSQRGLKLRHVNLVIETTEPLEIRVDRAVLDDVWIALRGPVTLRFDDRSRLSNVRVDMTPLTATQSEPRLTLDSSEASDLTVASLGETHPGVVTATRTRIDGGHLVGHEIVLESVVSDRLHVDAERFSAFDFMLARGQLTFGEGLIVSSEILTTRVDRCGAATIAGSLVSESMLSPCSAEPLRVYNTLVEVSFVDGNIDSDTSIYQGVIFGSRAPTELLSWDTTFEGINLCKHTARVRLGVDSRFSCARCDGLKKQAELCKLPDLGVVVEKSDCPALAELAPCKGRPPIRARPQVIGKPPAAPPATL